MPRDLVPSADLILSSGFLAFARHLGAIDAVRARGVRIEAVVGTSSGALVGALFQSGKTTEEVARLLSSRPPIHYMRPHLRPWRGLFSLAPLLPLLRDNLPERFEDLPNPFAVGVRNEAGVHQLIHQGDLLSAVMASIAIPYVFPPVSRGGHIYVDGGVADRTGVAAWREWRPGHHAIVHVVDRSRGRDVAFDSDGTTPLRTPRAHAKFWDLGDFDLQRAEAQAIVERQLARRDSGIQE